MVTGVDDSAKPSGTEVDVAVSVVERDERNVTTTPPAISTSTTIAPTTAIVRPRRDGAAAAGAELAPVGGAAGAGAGEMTVSAPVGLASTTLTGEPLSLV